MFDRFFLIAGPCVLEDDAINLGIAESLRRLGADLDIPVIFKASFDKANRSKGTSFRGPHIEKGLEMLARVREETDLPVLTDIHEAGQASVAAEVVDVLQIPAFLCRQTDLLEAAGGTGRPVNVKKGQWMSAEAMAHAVDKVRRAGGSAVAVTERGTFFGYGDLVVDMRNLVRMRVEAKKVGGAAVVFDGTHSVQRPGKGNGSSGGNPEHTPDLVRAAVACGCDGLFLEVHPNPADAKSDAATVMPLEGLRPLVEMVLAIREVVG